MNLAHVDMTSDGCVGCTPVMRERDAAAALGVSRRKVLALIADGAVERVRRGVIVGACTAERATTDRQLAHAIALRTLLLTYDDCFASHESAAYALDLPVLDLPPYAIATREHGAWRGGAASRVRIAPLPPHHVTTAHGLRCTTAARTAIDVARSGTFREAVVVGDAVRRDHCDLSTLQAVLMSARPGPTSGRRALHLDSSTRVLNRHSSPCHERSSTSASFRRRSSRL